MIGQVELQNTLIKLIKEDKLPKYMIFAGQRGSGRSTLATLVATLIGATVIKSDGKVDDVRNIIEQSYKLDTKIVCVFPNVDRMSNIAQNTMLKFTEEPPENATIIFTAENESFVLPTLKSRGTLFHINPYTKQELTEFAFANKLNISATLMDDVLDICETPYELTCIASNGAEDFLNYVHKVVDNIAYVSGSNSFKIGKRLNLSNSDDLDKFDLGLFWKGFIAECNRRMMTNPVHFAKGIQVTCASLQELRTTGINKQMCFDTWLLNIRQEWF